MIEDLIKEKLEKIFDFKRVSFDEPSEDIEQNCLYITLDKSQVLYKHNEMIGRIDGSCRVYAPSDKLKVGYISKRISMASPELTKEFFFYDFEENAKIFLNIVGKSFKFIYLFNGDFNPNEDIIEDIEFTTEEE